MADDLVRDEFKPRKLNERGLFRANEIREAFSQLMNVIESECGQPSRELSIAKTHIETAAHFAMRALCNNKELQEVQL